MVCYYYGIQLSYMTLNPQHRDFLNKRGITDKIIDAFSISTVDVPFLRLEEAIAIPINHLDGTHFFNKYRRNPLDGNITPKYLYDKGGKVTLYGADKLVAESPIVITEGELDTLVCWSLGIQAVSSTGGAMSFQEDWAKLLRYKSLDIFICFDNDEAGHKGAIKVLQHIPDAKVIFIPKNIPDVKDISDYVARGGDFHALMRSAKSYPDLETVEAEKESIAANWGDYTFHDLFIKANRPQSLPTDVSGKANRMVDKTDKVAMAKAVDCRTLLEFKRIGGKDKAMCQWHNDTEPSLTFYPKKNNCYCFACGKYADGIDIVIAQHYSTLAPKEAFKRAVERLSGSAQLTSVEYLNKK